MGAMGPFITASIVMQWVCSRNKNGQRTVFFAKENMWRFEMSNDFRIDWKHAPNQSSREHSIHLKKKFYAI